MNPKISFKERAKLGKEQLAKQEPFTLKKLRVQIIWLKVHSNHGTLENREADIKRHLKIYHPKWTDEKIDTKLKRIMICKTQEEIAKQI